MQHCRCAFANRCNILTQWKCRCVEKKKTAKVSRCFYCISNVIKVPIWCRLTIFCEASDENYPNSRSLITMCMTVVIFPHILSHWELLHIIPEEKAVLQPDTVHITHFHDEDLPLMDVLTWCFHVAWDRFSIDGADAVIEANCWWRWKQSHLLYCSMFCFRLFCCEMQIVSKRDRGSAHWKLCMVSV